MRVFMVHGVGHGDDPTAGDWQELWKAAFRSSAKTAGYATPDDIDFAFARFDDIFSRYPLDAKTIARGLLVLARDAMGPPPGWTTRDLLGLDLAAKLRWTAGMVLQWIEKK